MSKVHIQLMSAFAIYINDEKIDQLVEKSRKGVALMQMLILHHGEVVTNAKLMSCLWSGEKSTNPENALKTLVSRLRATLNQLMPELGGCIVAERGAYRWKCMPGMTVDVYEVEELCAKLANGDSTHETLLFEQLMNLYTGDLLVDAEQNEWALSYATSLHNRYLAAVYTHLDMLKAQEDYDSIIVICRKALEINSLDDHLHMELMTALINTGRNNEAMLQYKYVVHLYQHYLGVRPSDNMQAFYRQIVSTGKTLDLSLVTIRNELRDGNGAKGAFICDYMVFKEIFDLQMRNLERLGATIFLGVIMVGGPEDEILDPIRLDCIMQGLIEVLRTNLRKGDTVSRYSPSIVAVLLPMVNYSSGHIVMERIKKRFYQKYPNCSVTFSYRIGPMSSDVSEQHRLQWVRSGENHG